MRKDVAATSAQASSSFCGADASEPCRKALHAAAAIFAGEGFAGARVDAIAERAGMNKAMVYYHVGDKARLYEAVFCGTLDRAREALEAALATKTSPEEKLRTFVSIVAGVARENPHFPALILREFAGGGTNLPESVLRRIGGIFRIVRQVLEEGRADGSLRVASPLLTHLVIAGSVMFLSGSGPIMKKVAELEGMTVPSDVGGDVAGPLADLLLRGLLDVPGGSAAGPSRAAIRGRSPGRRRTAPTFPPALRRDP